MNKHLNFLLGMTIIIVGIFASTFEKMLVPIEPSVAQVLNIQKPDIIVLDMVSGADKIVTNKQDKEKMSLLNYEFSQRLKGYDCKPEEMIQIWNHVARFVSNKGWVKYKGFSPKYTSDMIKDVTTDANSIVTDKEKDLISEKFNGLSWVLGNKNE